MESALAIILILAVVFGFAMAYKRRVAVAKWLNDPDLLTAGGNRKKQLRRRIEDAQEELEAIQKKEAETGD